MAVKQWLGTSGVKTLYSEPGSPWQNAYVESFNGTLEDELLGRELFTSPNEAKLLVEQYRLEHNHERPHSALDYQTPAEFAVSCDAVNVVSAAGGAPAFDHPQWGDGRRQIRNRALILTGTANGDASPLLLTHRSPSCEGPRPLAGRGEAVTFSRLSKVRFRLNHSSGRRSPASSGDTTTSGSWSATATRRRPRSAPRSPERRPDSGQPLVQEIGSYTSFPRQVVGSPYPQDRKMGIRGRHGDKVNAASSPWHGWGELPARPRTRWHRH
jgi:hypothetical protein